MSPRSSEFKVFLTNCLKRKVDCNRLSEAQVALLIEVCHNIITNPKVLLSESELRCLKPLVAHIKAIGRTRQIETARPLLTHLKGPCLPTLARIALKYYK